jgi:hypothetical protein
MPNPFERYNQGDNANTPKPVEQNFDRLLDKYFSDEECEMDEKGNWITTKRNKILSPEEGLEDVERRQEVAKPLAQNNKTKPEQDLDLNQRLDRFFPDEFEDKD